MIDWDSPLQVCGMAFFISVAFLGSGGLAVASVAAFFLWHGWNAFTA